jgi:BMFP domain-containing protein YqiC
VREQGDALSAADRKHLKRCSEFLSEELANALDKPRAEVLEQMAKVTQA